MSLQPQLPYGSCLATLPTANGTIDLTPDMQLATGRDVLTQSLIRRQTTPRGSVITSPNDCIDLRALISSGMTQTQLQQLASQLKSELLRDPRVLFASVQITVNPANGQTAIFESLQSAAGPFTLTIVLTGSTITQIISGQ